MTTRAQIPGGGNWLAKGFDFVAQAFLAIGRCVGWTYRAAWGYSGLSWYDHRADFFFGPANWHWSERGVLATRLIPDGGRVLDLCSGDGIYSGLFYSLRALHVDAVDIDDKALGIARRRYMRPNVIFHRGDIVRDPFPGDDYDVVCMFAGIEHFAPDAGMRLLQKIAKALAGRDAVFIGSTPIFPHRGGFNPDHENEFLDLDDLRRFLEPHFESVDLWISPWPRKRSESYFECRGPRVLSEDKFMAATAAYTPTDGA